MADIFLEIGIDEVKFKKAVEAVIPPARKAGEKAGDGFSNEFSKRGTVGFKKLGKAALAAGAAIGAALFSRASIQAAQVQEDAVNKLNSALFQTGEFSKGLSKELQEFAAQIQSSTRFGDEAILQQLAYAKSLGVSTDQSKALIQASADLSSALGISLEAANRNLVKSFSGLAGELGELVPGIRGLTAEQLKAGGAVALVSKQFAGFAERDVKTFSGAIAQARNDFGDLLEEIGFLITKNPAVIQAITLIRDGIKGVIDTVKNNSGVIIEFSAEVLRFAISAAASIDKTLRGALDGLGPVLAAIGSIFSALDQQGGGLFKGVLLSFGLFKDSLVNGFNVIKTIALAVFIDIADAINILPGFNIDTTALNESLDNAVIKTDESSLAVRERISALLDADSYTTERPVSELFIEQIGLINESLAADAESGSAFSTIFDAFSEENLQAITDRLAAFGANAKKPVDDLANTVKKGTIDISNALKNSLVNTAAAAFQQFGQQLAEGKLNFKSFVGLAISAIGDLAIVIGTAVLNAALAIKAIPTGAGIFLGAALITIGGAIKALAGSFGGGGGSASLGPSGSASSGSGFATTPAPFQEDGPLAEEERRADQFVQVVVQGDILDSEESGTRILKLLTDNFKTNNGALVQGRFA